MDSIEHTHDLQMSIYLHTDDLTNDELNSAMRKLVESTQRASFYAVATDSVWWDLDEWEIFTDYDPNRFCRGGWIKGHGWTIRLIDADDPTIYVPPDVHEDYEAEPGLYIFPAESRHATHTFTL